MPERLRGLSSCWQVAVKCTVPRLDPLAAAPASPTRSPLARVCHAGVTSPDSELSRSFCRLNEPARHGETSRRRLARQARFRVGSAAAGRSHGSRRERRRDSNAAPPTPPGERRDVDSLKMTPVTQVMIRGMSPCDGRRREISSDKGVLGVYLMRPTFFFVKHGC